MSLRFWGVLSAVLVVAGCQLPPDYGVVPYADLLLDHQIEHRFDSRAWRMDYMDANELVMVAEWVLEEESVEEWTELITYQAFRGSQKRTPRQVMEFLVNGLQPNSVGFKYAVLEESATELTFAWSHQGSGGYPPQREVCKLMIGDDAMYRLAYTVKESAYVEDSYCFWELAVGDAYLQVSSARSDPEQLRSQALIESLEEFRGVDFYVYPYIPVKQGQNIRETCQIPASEVIYMLINSSSFDSAKNGLVATDGGIYFHNDWTGKPPGRTFIPYGHFVDSTIERASWCEVGIGDTQFNLAGSSVSKKQAIAALEKVQAWAKKQRLQEEGRGADAETTVDEPL